MGQRASRDLHAKVGCPQVQQFWHTRVPVRSVAALIGQCLPSMERDLPTSLLERVPVLESATSTKMVHESAWAESRWMRGGEQSMTRSSARGELATAFLPHSSMT